MALTSSTAAARARTVDPVAVEHAVLRTIAYSDVFDYPLRPDEVHSWLHGLAAPADLTGDALEWCTTRGRLVTRDGFYALPGRERIAELRLERAERARALWPAALWYGSLLAQLPFVRMVAITGSLAWDNVGDGADVDFLIVSEPGRVWLVRWLAAGLRRGLAGTGLKLCANYVLSERTLTLQQRDVYVACELVGMRIFSGMDTYARMRDLNDWVRGFFPNAAGPRHPPTSTEARAVAAPMAVALSAGARVAEPVLRTAIGDWLERLEMGYRRRKYDRAIPLDARADDCFSADTFKCHSTFYHQRTLGSFESRLRALGIPRA